MDSIFDRFEKKKDFLICVDSDGCAMDTMDCKHQRCFGPCMVAEWGLEAWEDAILSRWNEINLYTMTRGINRFKGLAMALLEINDQYQPIDGVQDLKHWADTAKELSNPAVEAMWKETGKDVFRKALSWSQVVNRSIGDLPEEVKQPFPGAKEGLANAQVLADVAVVSSANRDAVEEEWNKFGLLEHVDILLCQDAGSKAHCIGELLKKGYAPEHVLMVGDAPGDQAAAAQNGVYYYPILVRREAESWKRAKEAFDKLVNGTYADFGEQMKQEFLKNLGGNT